MTSEEIEFRKNMESYYSWLSMVNTWGEPFVNFVLGLSHKEAMCRRKGHQDLTVEGHATPNSGWEDWDCDYCGQGGTTTYY